MKEHAKSNLAGGFVWAIIVWVVLYGWNVVKAVYIDHQQLVSRSSELAAQIKNLEQRDVAVPLSPVGARVEVNIGQLTVSPPPTRNAPFSINVFMVNKGKSTASAIVYGSAFSKAQKPAPAADEDSAINELIASLSSQKPIGNELEPGDNRTWFTASYSYSEFTAAEYKNVLKGKLLLYFFVTIQWRDKTMPDREVGISEFCGYFTKSFDFVVSCVGHNRTYPQRQRP